MSKCTLRNAEFLKELCKKNRRSQIKKPTSDNIQSLTEIARNALKGNINYNISTKKKLNKFKKQIRNLAAKRISVKKKKNILLQRGGFLPLLITPVLSAAGALAGKYLAHELGL